MSAHATVTAGTSSPSILPPLRDYLECCQRRFEACVSALNHPIRIDGVDAEVTLHFVRFDPATGEPKFKVLAKALAKHVVRFSLSVRTRESVQKSVGYDDDEGELFMLARDYFGKLENSGEVGELLLFFLLEAAVGAPQVVCKMELKTNPKDEVKGTDGIHVKWDDCNGHLDVFLGEAKLYQDISPAISKALESVSDLYDSGRLDEELHLVTAHFKHLDEEFKTKVTAYLKRETSENECHVIHACLVGWDWPKYAKLKSKREALFAEFEGEYRQYAVNIARMLNSRFSGFAHRHLSFHFLFLPFSSVGEFRRAFYRELLGADLDPKTRNDFLSLYTRVITEELQLRLGMSRTGEGLLPSEVNYLLQTASMLSLESPDDATPAMDPRAWRMTCPRGSQRHTAVETSGSRRLRISYWPDLGTFRAVSC